MGRAGEKAQEETEDEIGKDREGATNAERSIFLMPLSVKIQSVLCLLGLSSSLWTLPLSSPLHSLSSTKPAATASFLT